MSLSRQSLSPTANLLRNSRLFSLPNPLPKPPVGESFRSGITKASDTATLPYPTQQAIATTKSSLARGDWGLKRPLPQRSYLVQVSDPVLRVNQLDTIEHVTDFDSAADHVRTRQKWEAMGVPMMKGMTQMRDKDLSGTPPAGAFEIRDDTTSYDTELGLDESGLYLKALKDNVKTQADATKKAFDTLWMNKRQAQEAEWDAQGASGDGRVEKIKAFEQEQAQARKQLNKQLTRLRKSDFTPFTPPPVDAAVHNTKRWKHDGPWLPGMSADDFLAYLNKEITKRKPEFHRYLVEFVKNEIYTTRRLAASQAGEAPPMDMAEAEAWHARQEKQWRNITPDQIDAGIKSLRKETANNPLGSKLVTKLILPFLRLPAIKFKYTSYAEDASTRAIDQYQFDQETAPLSTHPSAGLGYLRTRSYITNHPILGPQAQPTPVTARVIQPRTAGTSKQVYARLGVGGFVANDQYRSTDVSSGNRAGVNNARDVETIDIDTPGGKKLTVQPLFGSVTNDGRIHIKVKRSQGPEVQVAKGALDDRPPVREFARVERIERFASGKESGVKELDEFSGRAKMLSGFLEGLGEGQGKGE
ncbi:hypothetical protein IAQ61_002092 [Plenodomus lingam]|uniref:Predicted protein n=1 Tax=Leptosphaeria maculans (strain JN3 / isolate v23.1.3 / race Av1-4-5-6-7-8) TaxID=985895 RepID=E4ZH30_LEPMJ|nr:predicted protein [Plenodomus lingam JN3]KAH9876732.1 hypothetical protein IAQ61_002092 [Plenodomus lingam]CBX90600.1 predicted protein [Plenodomus lingam JN3]